ncbi:MAG: serine/threonine protein kinase [Mycoplasmataceae bacterium RV_VA103A]|nr:MAG: serine/threonine protein kinase [Mycoplasmataceae bacterium RV_VA103A]
MVKAQEWLDKNYPKEQREFLEELKIADNNLEGELDLRDFPKLKRLFCHGNDKITKLILLPESNLELIDAGYNLLTDLVFLDNLDPRKLKILKIHQNNIQEQDLSCFSRFTNLTELAIGNCYNYGGVEAINNGIYNKFYGSLQPLQNLSKLETLTIWNSNVDSGLEYLPESLKIINCSNEGLPNSGCRNLLKQLEKYRVGGDSYDYQAWRKDNQELIEKVKKEKQLTSLGFLNKMILSFPIGSKKWSGEEVEKLISENYNNIILKDLQVIDLQSLKEETSKKVKDKIISDYKWLAKEFHNSLKEEKITEEEESEIAEFFEKIKVGGRGYQHPNWIDGQIQESRQKFKNLDYIERVYIDTLKTVINESSGKEGSITVPSGRKILTKEELELTIKRLEKQRADVKRILNRDNKLVEIQLPLKDIPSKYWDKVEVGNDWDREYIEAENTKARGWAGNYYSGGGGVPMMLSYGIDDISPGPRCDGPWDRKFKSQEFLDNFRKYIDGNEEIQLSPIEVGVHAGNIKVKDIKLSDWLRIHYPTQLTKLLKSANKLFIKNGYDKVTNQEAFEFLQSIINSHEIMATIKLTQEEFKKFKEKLEQIELNEKSEINKSVQNKATQTEEKTGHKQLEKEIDKIKTESEGQKETINKLKSQITAEKEKIANKEAEIKTSPFLSEAEIEILKKELTSLKGDLVNLQGQLVVKEGELEELRKKCEDLEKKFSLYLELIDEYKQERVKAGDLVSEMKKEGTFDERLINEFSQIQLEVGKLEGKIEVIIKKEGLIKRDPIKNLRSKGWDQITAELGVKSNQYFTVEEFGEWLEENVVKIKILGDIKPTLEHQIGKGGYGEVYYGKWKSQEVAVKKLCLSSNNTAESGIEDIRKEIYILKNLKNRHVIQYYDIYSDNHELLIIMDYAENGTLTKFINDSKDKEHDWNFNKELVRQMTLGLTYIHQSGIIHRDLKSLNILLTKNNEVKISDFGLAKAKDIISSSSNSTEGSLRWMAPETLRGQKCSEQSDIYSLGMVIWEIAAKCTTPFKGIYNILLYVSINNGREIIPEETPKNIRDIIESCWKDNPNERIALTDVLKTVGGDILTSQSVHSNPTIQKENNEQVSFTQKIAETTEISNKIDLEIPDDVESDYQTQVEIPPKNS